MTARVVCVLGMHRSGTSLVARVVNLLGGELGPAETLQPPAADNPRGFWEHRGIVGLNDEILQALGGSWSRPPRPEAGWEKSPRLDVLRGRAEEILHADFGRSEFWAWKDPRTCLTLPFWRRLVPAASYVLCVRNPLAVARSLERRDGLPYPKSGELWTLYVRSALEHASGGPLLVVSYDDLVDDPPGQFHRLARFVGREGRADDPGILAQLHGFVDRDLRHERPTADQLGRDTHLPLECKTLYFALRAAAGSSANVAEMLAALSHVSVAAGRETAGLRRAQWDLEAAVARLEEALRRRDADRRSLDAITSSRSYPLLLWIWRLHRAVAPRGSRRWRWLERGLGTAPNDVGEAPLEPFLNGHRFGPILVGATEGSGTRVLVRILVRAGAFMGHDLGRSGDAAALAAFAERWAPRPPAPPPSLSRAPAIGAEMAADLAAALREHCRDVDPARPWGWKEPRVLSLLPVWHQALPGLRLVHLVRDGRDMAFSPNRNPLRDPAMDGLTAGEREWSEPRRAAALWGRVNTAAADYAETRLRGRYLRLRFEDLCADPETAVAQLLRFAGLDADAGRIAREEVHPPPSLGQWRRIEGAESDGALRSAAGGALERFGY